MANLCDRSSYILRVSTGHTSETAPFAVHLYPGKLVSVLHLENETRCM